jgi:hypothetical protein
MLDVNCAALARLVVVDESLGLIRACCQLHFGNRWGDNRGPVLAGIASCHFGLLMTHIITDRSRIECSDHCQRERFWRYEYRGRGIEPATGLPDWWYLTGHYCHEGIEAVLSGETPHAAANLAKNNYATATSFLISSMEDGEVKQKILGDLQEQLDLVKALVYAWGRVQYPKYQREYHPVDIEREESITFTVGDDEVELLTRTDLLSEYLSAPGHYVIHNFKTVSTADQKWRQQWRYDQQTLTEYIACENRLGKQVVGVIIEGLLKGKRSEFPEDSGIWRHSSPLVYCWYRAGEPPMTEPEFYARYKWTCTEPHNVGAPKKDGSYRQCPGGRNHSLSGVYKEQVEKVYPGGILAWIDHLIATDLEIVERQFVTLEPITRSDWEVERWKRQVLHRELRVSDHSYSVNQAIANPIMDDRPAEAGELLDHYFPMRTSHGNCLRPSQCAYFDICWGAADPDDPSKFKARVPNHPAENTLWQIAGTNGGT